MSEPYWEPFGGPQGPAGAAGATGPAGPVLPRLDTVCQTITDWNTAKDNGWYMGSGATNAPTAGVWYYGEVIQHNASWVTQRVRAFAGDYRTYVRHLFNGTWTGWIPEAVDFQTGIYQTGVMSNNTGYGWNVFFPVAFQAAPRAVICTFSTWTISYASVWGPWALNYTTTKFDLYLYNTNNSENVGIRWMAFA
jgi:hypothetical protein